MKKREIEKYHAIWVEFKFEWINKNREKIFMCRVLDVFFSFYNNNWLLWSYETRKVFWCEKKILNFNSSLTCLNEWFDKLFLRTTKTYLSTHKFRANTGENRNEIYSWNFVWVIGWVWCGNIVKTSISTKSLQKSDLVDIVLFFYTHKIWKYVNLFLWNFGP